MRLRIRERPCSCTAMSSVLALRIGFVSRSRREARRRSASRMGLLKLRFVVDVPVGRFEVDGYEPEKAASTCSSN